MWIGCWKGERETSSVFNQRKGGIHYLYVHVAVGGDTFSIIDFQRGEELSIGEGEVL